MRQRKFFIFCAVLSFVIMLANPLTVFADDAKYSSAQRRISIATVDNRPLSIDRLLYTAFNDIGYHAAITTTASLQQSYTLANAGERDGVISSTPDMELLYPDLIKVPVVLENNNVLAFSRVDGNITVAGWDDLSGFRVGVLTGRVYIQSQIPQSASITAKENTALVFEGLLQNEYDLVVLSIRGHETLVPPEDVAPAGEIETLPEYLYMNKKHEYLIPDITATLDKVFADGLGEKILSDIQLPQANRKKTVLHIFSSNMQVAREEQLSVKLRGQFENDMSVDWYTVELNSRNFSGDPSRLTYFANLLRQDCVSKNVAAIIVSGDDALDFLKNYYYLFFRNVPVLFYGINEDYEAAIRGYEPFFTGIAEQISVYETVSLALELFPDAKNLYVINDYTTEGGYYRVASERELEPMDGALSVEYNKNTDGDTLFERIKELPQDTLVFVGSYFYDLNGQHYPLKEMKRLLDKDCAVPVFALYSTNVEYNSIGGKCLDYEKYGEILADMLGRVLNGENAAGIPAVTDPAGYSRWVFDRIMMDKMGVMANALPAGIQIINNPPSIWESDPWFAFTLVTIFILSVAIVIGTGVFMIRYRKQKELSVQEAKIREVKERLESIINTAPVAYMLTIDGIVAESNEYAQKHMGVREGYSAHRLYTDPSQRDWIIEKALSQKVVENHVIRCNMPGGDSHRFLANITAIEYDGRQAFILWAMNIEERERQKDQLRTAQQDLEIILDTMPVAVRIVDRATELLTYANRAALEMFNCRTLEDVAGRYAYDFMPEVQPDGTKTVDLINNIDLSGKSKVEIQCLKLTGELFYSRTVSCVISYNGKISSLAIIEDLTAEREYQRMLRGAAEKEREANQLKSRFLVNMSHEIRTPMNAIIGITEIELHKNPPRDIKEIYKKINISAKNLLEIINDILDLSKIEANKIELFKDEFELEDVLNSAILVAAPRLDGKNVEFILNVFLDLPRYIIGDRTRLWQILKNFLDNSAKFTENGKIVLTTFINRRRSDDQTVTVTFIIEDTGIGIDEAQMQKLFLPYEQVHNEAQKKYSGTGLGLAISKQLCEIMGGDLQIESIMGVGTTVIINIPFKRSQSAETGMNVVKSPFLAGLNVLAVDDDELSLDIMARLLEGAGASCVQAMSGMEAMEIVLDRRDRGEAFDIILLDYMMKGLNGIETAKQIHLALSQAPKLLMVTAYQKLILKHELEGSGIDSIIEKPFIPSQFIHKLCVSMGYEDVSAEPVETFIRFKDATVLLCEDYRLNQEVAAGMFAQFGVMSEIAENGKQGIEILNSGKPFDLIFMDIQMPVMDGYEASCIIRADPRFDNIPIISLTADAMKESVEKCMEVGMDDHIAKPMEFARLFQIFMKWLPESKRMEGDKLQIPSADPENDYLARFDGNIELYENARLEFATELLPDEWPEFNNATENAEKIGRFVHKLKGVAGNLSEKEIYRCAAEFENSLRGGNPSVELYDRLITACDTAKKAIIKRARSQSDTSFEVGTVSELNILLIKLEDALRNYNPITSADAVKSLKKKSWPSIDEQTLLQLYSLVRTYEFDAALDALGSMKVGQK